MAYRVPPWFRGHFLQMFFLCYNAYLCWLILSECRLLEYWTCMQEPFMPYMRLLQSMETVNITFLYLLLRRAEYLGHENSAFCDSSVVAENIYLRTVVCLDCNFCRCVFEADFLFLSPYKVDVTLFQFVNRKIVCEFEMIPIFPKTREQI